ncbi:MAG: hypothetical protein AAGD05_03210 [Bacteroidota bacterium]
MQAVENIKKLLSFSCLVLGCLLSSHSVSAQARLNAQNSTVWPVQPIHFSLLSSSTNLASPFGFTSAFGVGHQLTPSYHAPEVYSYQELGIFCKIDVQLEKTMKLPVKFRLGTVQYVDQREGKRW